MFQIHAVTANQAQSIEQLSEHIVALLPYVDYVQIREKSRSPKAIVALIDRIAQHASTHQLILNDRTDIALAMGIERVHLTESSLPLAVLKNAFPSVQFGRSFHNGAQIRAQLPEYAYGYIGHIFQTRLKTDPPLGLAGLTAIAKEKRAGTLIAIGGIDEANIASIAPIVDGVAVMSGLFERSIAQSIAHAKSLKLLAEQAIIDARRTCGN
ncbi:thiamine phosphate synthase [Wohlfahrtiimonas chitiniclastica]|uniref:thiamine phosphate synthase n=1 Tax=Wohlfahrtiimonas chitiniclastica TaxID=400946 RepID=UPI000B994F88|nr:thiamine phosphate synthase [Wohlfahrtiimonas chitiniclastica]OYQ87944.1 thiamine phosphate synthase [Wohlfahrtiimonas chitiniclastica]